MQFGSGGACEFEGVIEFAISQQSSVTGDFGAEESESETAVELGSESLGLAVTHKESPSFRQESMKNPGITGNSRNSDAVGRDLSGKSRINL
jgi:hypothetical protein